jgi:conjugative relaxase-like TrwC/TraI family protein
MLTLSKALSANQARTYHAREFTSEKQNYWSRDRHGHSEWQGELARDWALHGSVADEQFARLSEGQHPESAVQLVRHQPAKTYETNTASKSRARNIVQAGMLRSPRQSRFLTALVGDDGRVRGAHRKSVRLALHELERYPQARIGNVNAPETTSKFIAATFEHDTARPVDGHAAPQLHTHAVIFNITKRGNGQTRTLQERSLFPSQQCATTVHLDHGYSVTSHSSQGQTAERVLIHVDTELGAKGLAKSPYGVCFCFAWTVGRTDIHQQPRKAG